jgi:hypothetical protein
MRKVRSETKFLKPKSISVETLGAAGQFSIFATRVWSSASKQKMPIEDALDRLFTDFRCFPALKLFDECMVVATVSAMKSITIGCCPSNPMVVADEAVLLDCFHELERGNPERAESVIEQIVIKPMARTYCRPAEEFVQCLNRSGLSFTPKSNLSLVTH